VGGTGLLACQVVTFASTTE